MTLKNKMFIFNFLTFFGGLILFSTFTIKSIDSKMLDSYKQFAKQEIDMVQNNLDILLTSSEDSLRIMSTDDDLQDAMQFYLKNPNLTYLEKLQLKSRLGQTISNLIYPNTRMEGVVVWGTDDKILYAGYSLKEESVYKNIGKDYLNRTTKNQKATWGELISLEKIEGNTFFSFPVSKIVIDKDTGMYLGKITLLLNENEIGKVYDNYKANEKMQYIILDSKKNIATCSQHKNLGENVLKSKLIEENLLDQLENTKKVFIQGENIWSIKEYERMQWKVISKGTIDGYRQLQKSVIQNTMFIALILGIIGFWGAFIIARKITQPLYSLINTMKIIRSGDMKARTQQFLQKEIAVLANEFNVLMEKLEESMEQIYVHQKNKRINELKLLQAQVKPHFLYNTLETISSLIKLDYKEKSLQMLQLLSGFYRKSLSNGKEIIQIKDEIEIIKNYLQIQSIRYEKYMNYTIDINPDILECETPKLVLQPLVENALYHGIKLCEEKEVLIVRGYCDENYVYIEVFDSGMGIKEEKLNEIRNKLSRYEDTSSRDSFGLFNVNERIQLYYGEKYGIEIESVEGEYTQVCVKLPNLKNM